MNALLFSIVSAPYDGDEVCMNTPFLSTTYPRNVRPLMDSYHYINLLPPHEGAVWHSLNGTPLLGELQQVIFQHQFSHMHVNPWQLSRMCEN